MLMPSSKCRNEGCCYNMEIGNQHRIPYDCTALWLRTIYCWEIVIDTCEVISTHLFNRCVKIPQGGRLHHIIDDFENRWGFLQVVGAIDGTHIPIIKSDYFNRKGFYSIIMQAVVDSRGLFLDAYIGWPGKVHDARVLVNSTLYKKMLKKDVLPNWTRQLGGVEIPLLILGDPAYPLLPWLMKSYLENEHATPEERHFNYRHSRARMTIENAFGGLKGRWRCLLKQMDMNIANIPNVVATCVALHNYCEMHGDECQPEWVHTEVNATQQSAPTHGNTKVYSRSVDPRKLRVGVKYYVVHSCIHQNHILRLLVCTRTARANCAQK